MLFDRIAVVGAGAMGTVLGAALTQAGLRVELVDVNQEHVDALNARGASVVGTVSWHVPVRALTPAELEGTYDLVFLLTKQTHNKTVFAQLEPHLHDESVVCTLQNGVPEPALAAAFGPARAMGGAVTWAATYLAPGLVESTAGPEAWHIYLGPAAGDISDSAEEVHGILSTVCSTELVENLAGIRWSKLLVNASFSGMSAALGCTFGEILDSEKAFRCAQHIARECIRVAAAHGLEMAQIFPGVDFRVAMEFDSEEERLATSGIYQRMWGAVRPGKASMLQDLENGRKTEIDYINGLVSDTGRLHGIPTPASDTVVQVVKGIEEGRLRPRFDNLDLFSL